MMEKVKIISLLLIIFLFPVAAISEAQFVSLQQARLIAELWMQRVGEDKIVNEGIILQDEKGKSIGYLFNFSGGGFVVVPTEDLFEPIKAWSKDGSFSSNSELAMDMGVMVIESLVRQAKFIVHTLSNKKQVLQVNKAWTLLEKRSFVTTDDIISGMVGPLLKTTWSQQTPYNNYCPLDNNGERSVTGCVATAIAQILKYWEWPKVGSGSKCYDDYFSGSISCGTNQYICADFSHEYYWNLMIDSYSWFEGQPSPENDAVARLMADVGVLAKTCYSSTESSGFYAGLVAGLPEYLGYSDDLHDIISYRDNFFPIIQEQINKRQPVFFSSDRHAYVADGYWSVDGMDQVHFNFGWGGSSDGWYTVESFDSFWEWDDTKNKYVSMVVDIHPLKGPPGFPSLDIDIEGQVVNLGWLTSDTEGYILCYSLTPFLNEEEKDVYQIFFDKQQTTASFVLPHGAMYYVAVQGYNRYGYGGLSEVKIIQVP